MKADKRIEELEKKVAALEVRVQEQPDIERIAEAVAKRLVFPDYDAKQLCKTTSVIFDSSEEIKVLDLRDLAKSFLSKYKSQLHDKKGAITMTKDILNSEISELREEIKLKMLKKTVKILDAENLNPMDLRRLEVLIDSLAKL